MLTSKEEAVRNYVENVLQSVEKKKELPALPRGIVVKDLPETTRMLYQLKQGEVPKEVGKLFR
jgi:hypothetical protein